MDQYCIDTSSLLEGWYRVFPADVFPTIWTKLEPLCENGTIIAPDEVFTEIKRKQDDLHKWAKQRNGLFYPMDNNLWNEAQAIMAQFKQLVQPGRSKNQADPFVVALAKMTSRVVITQECPKPSQPHIPDVCKYYGIRCIDLMTLARELKWQL